jgi:transposase-like protein
MGMIMPSIAGAGTLIVAILTGIGALGTLGAIIGALLGACRPEYEAKRYEGRMRWGGVLLSVHCDNVDWRVRAKTALRNTGAKSIASTLESKADFGRSEKPKPRAQMKGSGANASVAGDDEEMQRFVPIEDLFKGRHFDRQIIVLCVSWYTSFKLSLRDLVVMMAERGISVTHTTILRWVQRYLPEFEKRWRRYARPVGGSWRMDETYIKVHGQWVYLYRAVDKAGQTVDFFLSRNRDVNAAKSFLRSAMKNTRVPMKITLDAYAASHRAVREMKEDGELPGRVKVRSSQYLNNLVEQDHRRVKQRIRPMLGFKRFDNAVVTISGIELAEKIKKGQFKTGKLGGCNATMTELWNAALAA